VFCIALLRLPNRFVRQQQRSEIMQRFASLVNPFFPDRPAAYSC
jgi:hypothetical protein